MIPVLYSANTTDFSTFGLGVLTDTIFCEVTEERNGVFECLLKYPVSGQHYGLITKECIIKAKPNDTAADQAFRIYRITKPLNSIVTIYGQHISYAHPEKVNRRAYYKLVCKNCGEEFESYGNNRRTFCSRLCYTQYRRKEACK